jgi:hypothetical protein
MPADLEVLVTTGVHLGVQNPRRSWYSSDYSENKKGGRSRNR